MKKNDNTGTDMVSIFKRLAPGYLAGVLIADAIMGIWNPAFWIAPVVLGGLIFIDWALVSGFTKRALRHKDVCPMNSSGEHVWCTFCAEINVKHCFCCAKYF